MTQTEKRIPLLCFFCAALLLCSSRPAAAEDVKIGVLPVSGTFSEVIEIAITDCLLQEKGLIVVPASESRSMLKDKGELHRALECNDAACAAALGRKLGMDLVVLALVRDQGQGPALEVLVVDCANAEVTGRSLAKALAKTEPSVAARHAVMEARHRRAEVTPAGEVTGPQATIVDSIPLKPAGKVLEPEAGTMKPAGQVLKPDKEVIEVPPLGSETKERTGRNDEGAGRVHVPGSHEATNQPPPTGISVYTYLGAAMLTAAAVLGGVTVYLAGEASSEKGGNPPSLRAAGFTGAGAMASLATGITLLVLGSEESGTSAGVKPLKGGASLFIGTWW